MITYIIYNLHCDSPESWQLGIQDGATSVQEGILQLHDSISFYLIIILFGVLWMIIDTIVTYRSSQTQLVHKYANHGTIIELVWTITPAIILIAIAFPSFRLLYLIDEVISPSITIKAIGNQWFWTYEYSDFINQDGESIEFESYIVPESDLSDGIFRQLEVDNRLVLPIDTHVRIIVSSNDVLHDFAVPALGLKIDCTPGRLNQTSCLIERVGTFYGQCSENCGVYHGFIPIVVQAVTSDQYLQYITDLSYDE